MIFIRRLSLALGVGQGGRCEITKNRPNFDGFLRQLEKLCLLHDAVGSP